MQKFVLAYDIQYLKVIRQNLIYLLCYHACHCQQNYKYHKLSFVDTFKHIAVPCVTYFITALMVNISF
jgi:hypothetical protein